MVKRRYLITSLNPVDHLHVVTYNKLSKPLQQWPSAKDISLSRLNLLVLLPEYWWAGNFQITGLPKLPVGWAALVFCNRQ
jgi:hypothetical protein